MSSTSVASEFPKYTTVIGGPPTVREEFSPAYLSTVFDFYVYCQPFVIQAVAIIRTKFIAPVIASTWHWSEHADSVAVVPLRVCVRLFVNKEGMYQYKLLACTSATSVSVACPHAGCLVANNRVLRQLYGWDNSATARVHVRDRRSRFIRLHRPQGARSACTSLCGAPAEYSSYVCIGPWRCHFR